MGDRTWVALTVLDAHAPQVEALLKKHRETTEDVDSARGLTTYQFDEVNYGELDVLPDLKAAGIAHDQAWGRGGSYDPGERSLRFSEAGEPVKTEFYGEDPSIPIDALLRCLNHYDSLVELIRQQVKEQLPMPWDNQEDYGKIYQARQLITP